MTSPRFYAPDASRSGLTVDLPRGEAHQLARVLRLRRGAAVRVFDGRGREFSARVETVGRSAVTVHTLEPYTPVREPAVRLRLALAILKGRATDTVVRDATMLGVAAIQPLQTARSRPAPGGAPAAVERWRAIAVSSAKQCGRAVVPEIAPAASFMQFTRLSHQPSATAAGELRILLAEPALPAPHESIRVLAGRAAPAAATIVVGPEGGWTDGEVDAAAAAGFMPLTLGARTLRADAAPAAAIAVLQHVWDDL